MKCRLSTGFAFMDHLLHSLTHQELVNLSKKDTLLDLIACIARTTNLK